ncbi:MAG: VOC family protein [Pseudomonadota bacterium]
MTAGFGVDHIGLLGPDIETMAIACRNLGFTITGPEELYGSGSNGERVPLGQSSAHIMFARDYIELSSVHTPSPDHHLGRYLNGPYGIRILILASDDIAASAARAAAAGFALGPIQTATRDIHYGDRGTAEFRWCELRHRGLTAALVAFVEHKTPERVFAETPSHPNGAVGLRGLATVDAGLAEALAPLAADGGGIPLHVLSEAALRDDFGLEPCDCTPLCVAELGCGAVAETREYFLNHGIDFSERNGKLMTVAADTAFVFAAAD